MAIWYGGVEENVYLEGYVEYVETEQPPDESGATVVTYGGTFINTLRGFAEAVIDSGAPAKISVLGVVGAAPICIIEIAESQEEEGLLQATITAVSAAGTGMFVGARIGAMFGPEGAIAGAIVGGLFSGLVSFGTGYLYDEIYDGIENAFSDAINFLNTLNASADENGVFDVVNADIGASSINLNYLKDLLTNVKQGGLTIGEINVQTDFTIFGDVLSIADNLKSVHPSSINITSPAGETLFQYNYFSNGNVSQETVYSNDNIITGNFAKINYKIAA